MAILTPLPVKLLNLRHDMVPGVWDAAIVLAGVTRPEFWIFLLAVLLHVGLGVVFLAIVPARHRALPPKPPPSASHGNTTACEQATRPRQ